MDPHHPIELASAGTLIFVLESPRERYGEGRNIGFGQKKISTKDILVNGHPGRVPKRQNAPLYVTINVIKKTIEDEGEDAKKLQESELCVGEGWNSFLGGPCNELHLYSASLLNTSSCVTDL
jgi:hypothetical protein